MPILRCIRHEEHAEQSFLANDNVTFGQDYAKVTNTTILGTDPKLRLKVPEPRAGTGVPPLRG